MIRRLLSPLRQWVALAQTYRLSVLAFVWRRLMFRTTFIAVSGSVGKSTATACLGTILSAHCRTNWDPSSKNSRHTLARIILRTRPWHRFTVIEVGTRKPGALRRAAWMIAPDMVLMLRVLNVHSDTFPTIEEMAAEKAQLLSRMSRRGMAILNADDPLVRAMGERCRARIRTFGRSPGSDVMAADVSARWPRTLSFRVTCKGESVQAETKFLGEHLLNSALGAVATAVSCGVPLAEACRNLARVQPVTGRMQPVSLPGGATAICDTHNGALPVLEGGLDFLGSAESARRIAVVGDVHDSALTCRPRARDLGRRVAAAAEVGVFVGPEAKCSAKAALAAGGSTNSVAGFKTAQQTAAFLRSELRAGDLVFIQGWERRHLERIAIAQSGDIGCWVGYCPKHIQCDACPELKFVPFETQPPVVVPDDKPSWYLDSLVAAQKREVYQRWIRNSLGARSRRVLLKTDLFEEAFGDDLLLLDLFPDTQLTIGNDIEKNTVRAAARRGKAQFQGMIGDVRQFPLRSASVDVVVSSSTLDHFESKEELAQSLRELARVLRPGGVLLVTLDNPLNPLYYLLRWGTRRGWAPFELGATLSPAALRRMLVELGFEIESTDYLIHNPRGVSTLLFLALRRMLGARAQFPIRLLLGAFALLDRLPSRAITGCFVAVSASMKRVDAAATDAYGSKCTVESALNRL